MHANNVSSTCHSRFKSICVPFHRFGSPFTRLSVDIFLIHQPLFLAIPTNSTTHIHTPAYQSSITHHPMPPRHCQPSSSYNIACHSNQIQCALGPGIWRASAKQSYNDVHNKYTINLKMRRHNAGAEKKIDNELHYMRIEVAHSKSNGWERERGGLANMIERKAATK